MQRAHEIQHVTEPHKAYQVCVFDESQPDKDLYTFIAGMAVSETTGIPQGMIAHTVPEANFAVFEHRGLMDKMHQTYEYIFGIWLQENSYVMAEADSLEIYDERFIVDSPDSVFEIWVPVKKV